MVHVLHNFVRFSAIFVLVELRPLDGISTQNQVDSLGQNRAGIADLFNPQNQANNQNSNSNPGNNNSIFPNPFQNLLNATQAQNSNAFKDIKLFFLTVQGALMPASVITGGIPGFVQGLGNMGNMFGSLGQAAQNLNPFNQNKNK